jgi:hypothetical protein
MPQTSSLGAASPKQRTINVEVNLLAEWLERRNRLRDERVRWTGILATLGLAAIVTIPFLSDTAIAAAGKAQKAALISRTHEMTLLTLQAQQSQLQPRIDSDAMLQLCRGRATTLMTCLFGVLNATTPKVAVESIEATVLGGEVSIRTKAQAQTYESAQDYVSGAGQGVGVKSAILSTARQNKDLGPEGVSFEFTKKIEVAK